MSMSKSKLSLWMFYLSLVYGLGACRGLQCNTTIKDFSLFGSGQGLSGASVVYLLVFVKAVLQSLPHCLVHEKVLGFPIDVLKNLLKGFLLNFVLVICCVAVVAHCLLLLDVTKINGFRFAQITTTVRIPLSAQMNIVEFLWRGTGAMQSPP